MILRGYFYLSLAVAICFAPLQIVNGQNTLTGTGHEIGLPPKKDKVWVPTQPVFDIKGTGNEIGNPSGREELSPLIRDVMYGIESEKDSEASVSQEKSPLVPQAPVYLKVTIEHREKLDAVPDAFRAGNPIDVEKLQSLTPGNAWRKVPKDLSGTWVSEYNTIFWTRDLKNVTEGGKQTYVAGRENSTVHLSRAYKKVIVGYQVDRNGNQWTYDGGDLTEVIESDGYNTVDANFKRDVLEYTPEKMVIRNTSTRTIVKGSMISKTVQLEQIDINSLVSPGVRQVDISLKLFDENGDALVENRGRRVWHRIAPFAVVNEYQGHDMHALFIEYLKANNMTALVP